MPGFGLANSNNNSSNDQEHIEASTPWVAAADGKLSLLQSSLSRLNLSINAADENGYTVLQAAASYNQIPVLQWLLQQQEVATSINAVDNDGDSALHYAGNADAAKLLVEVGRINAAIRNKEGKTALQSKQEELDSMMEDDEDDNEDDATVLRQMIEYLSTLNG